MAWCNGCGNALRAFGQTIDLALHLQPDTQAVAIVAGATRWDSSQLAALHSELVRYQDKVKVIDIVGTPNYQLLERVAALPPRTVVMFQVYPQFSDEPDFGTWDLLTETTRRLPTYSAFPRLCIDGCIGGAYDRQSSAIDIDREPGRTSALGCAAGRYSNGAQPGLSGSGGLRVPSSGGKFPKPLCPPAPC